MKNASALAEELRIALETGRGLRGACNQAPTLTPAGFEMLKLALEGAMRGALDYAARCVCEGCSKRWTVVSIDGSRMHEIPEMARSGVRSDGTHTACEALWEATPRE